MAKTYDIDGNNILGNDGYYMVGVATVFPSYVNSGNFYSDSYYYTNGSYATVTIRSGTPGSSPSTILTGITNQNMPGYNNVHNGVVQFTLTGSVPSLIQVGIMTDNTDSSGRWGGCGFQISDNTATPAP